MDRVARPDKAKKTKVFEAGTVRPLEDVLGFGQSEFVWYLSRLSKENRRTLTEELKTKKGELEGKGKDLNHEEQAWKKSVGTKIRYVDGFFREHDVSAEQEIPDGEKIAEVLKRYPEIVSEEELDAAMPDRGSEALEALTMEVRDLQDVRSHISELWRRIESSDYVPGLRKGREKGAEEIEFGRCCKELDEKKNERDKYLHEFERIRNSLDRIQKALGGRINGLLNQARGGKDVSGALETLRAEQDEVIRMLNAVSFDRLEKRNGNKGGSESGGTPAAESEIVEPGSVSSAGEAGLIVSSPEPEPESLPTDAPEPELANGLKPGVSREPALADPVVGPIPETQTLHAVVESGNIESGRSDEMVRLDEAILKAEKELESAIGARGEYLRRIDAKREEVHARLEKARAVLTGAHIDDVEHQVHAELDMTEEDEAYQEIIRAAEERLVELRAQREALSMEMPETEGAGAVAPETGDGEVVAKLADDGRKETSERSTISDRVEKLLESFDIRRADVIGMAEFAGLTEGQQIFVAQMLRQSAAQMIEDRARDESGPRLMPQGYRLDKARKAVAEDVLHGGIDTYREYILRLAEVAVSSGFDMEEVGGKLEIRYASKLPEGVSGALLADWEAFNEAAKVFASVPSGWSLDGASKKERESFAKAKAEFDAAKRRVSGSLTSPDRDDDAKVYAGLTKEFGEIAKTEGRVRLMQHLQAHPEIDEYLRGVQEKHLGLSLLKSATVERGGYFVFGAGARLALAGTLGLFAAPAVASVSGAVTSFFRAKEASVRRDEDARRGREDARRPKTKNAFVQAAAHKDVRGGRRQGLAEKLETLVESVTNARDEDRGKELERLEARIAYTKRKLESGLVVLGDGPAVIANLEKLSQALLAAELTLGIGGSVTAFEYRKGLEEEGTEGAVRVDGRGLAKKMEGILDVRDQRIATSRNWEVAREVAKGAFLSGALALVGAKAMGYARDFFGAGPSSGPSREAISAKANLDRAYGDETVPGRSTGVRAAASAVPEAAPSSGRGVSEVASSTPASLEGAVRSAGGVVAEARRGDGLTHLARRAFAEYTGRTPEFKGLSAEQKIFVEDYLSKKVGHAGTVAAGDKVEFTDAMMREAAAKARGLSASQIENLHTFSEQVGEFRTGKSFSPEDFRRSGGAADGIVEAHPAADPVGTGKGLTHSSVGGEVPGAMERGSTVSPELEVLRRGVSSADAREFLAEPSNATAFRRAARGTMETLFPVSGKPGGIDGKNLFDALGGRRSDTLLRDCLLVVARSEQAKVGVLDVGIARRFGKFLIAAHRNGVPLKTEPGEQETLQAYIERFSVAMAKRGLDPAKQIALVTDEELDMRARGAAKAWQESRRGA